MRADMAAAFLDCRDTAELARRVVAGEAPRPTDQIGSGKAREPVWARETCERFIARRHRIAEHDRSEAEEIVSLL